MAPSPHYLATGYLPQAPPEAQLPTTLFLPCLCLHCPLGHTSSEPLPQETASWLPYEGPSLSSPPHSCSSVSAPWLSSALPAKIICLKPGSEQATPPPPPHLHCPQVWPPLVPSLPGIHITFASSVLTVAHGPFPLPHLGPFLPFLSEHSPLFLCQAEPAHLRNKVEATPPTPGLHPTSFFQPPNLPWDSWFTWGSSCLRQPPAALPARACRASNSRARVPGRAWHAVGAQETRARPSFLLSYIRLFGT